MPSISNSFQTDGFPGQRDPQQSASTPKQKPWGKEKNPARNFAMKADAMPSLAANASCYLPPSAILRFSIPRTPSPDAASPAHPVEPASTALLARRVGLPLSLRIFLGSATW
jgi:hypothetical protein